MNTGRVSFWNGDRGYGFIVPDSPPDAEPLFAHVSNVINEAIEELPKGARVSYETGESRRKPGVIEAKTIKVMK